MKTLGLVLTLAFGLFAAGQTETLNGVITDTMCGAKHSMMKNQPDDQCIRMCVKGPNEYALFDGTTFWKLSDQRKPARFAAQRVTVTGTVDRKAKVIKVMAVEPEK